MKRLALCLLLGGCVSASAPIGFEAGKYANYHDLVAAAAAIRVRDQSAPDAVKARFEECWADDTVSALTPDELKKLNAYARGEHDLAAGELQQMNDMIETRRRLLGRTQPGIDRISTTCPQDIPEFKKYLHL